MICCAIINTRKGWMQCRASAAKPIVSSKGEPLASGCGLCWHHFETAKRRVVECIGQLGQPGYSEPKSHIQTPTLASPDKTLNFQGLAGRAVSLTKGVLYH